MDVVNSPAYKKLKLVVVTKIVSLWRRWENYWFSPVDSRSLGFMRMLLCGVLFYMTLQRSFHLDYYTDSSWIPRSLHFFVIPELLRPAFSWFFWPDSWGPFFQYSLLMILGLATVGIGNRLFLLIAWVLQLAFIQRNVAISFGADHIATILLFLIALTPCFSTWSIFPQVKRILCRNSVPELKPLSASRTDMIGTVGYRLLKIQMCTIYCYTGLEKLKGSSWWEGTALWNVLANPQQTVADFTFLKHFPFVIAFATFFTVIYEVFWPVAVTSSRGLKRYWLLLGVFFHLSIGFMMGLMVFSLTMISTYVLFLSEQEYDQYIVSSWHKIKKRIGV